MTIEDILYNSDTTPNDKTADDGGQVDDENKKSDQSQQKSEPKDADTKIEFTPEQQAKIDEIVKGRLADERKKRDKAEEEAKLKAQGEYKELLEKREQELEDLRAEIKRKEIDHLRDSLLRGAGYSEEQLPFARKNVTGESEDELKASLAELEKYYPAQSGENIGFPSQGNGQRKTPPTADPYEAGRNYAKELLAKSRRRG